MDIKKAVKNAPSTPGVYIFRNKKRRILYIGKAANLRARLRSYANPGWKEQMLLVASSVEWEELNSDIEALIRESELVKKHKPHFNILLRDDKNYFFVAFTKDFFPHIYLTHQPTSDNKTTYIGPFTDGESIKRVLRLLRRAFPYCTCPTHTRHKRKCVNAEIGKCLGFCCADIPYSKQARLDYRANVTAIKKVLSGKTKILERNLLKKMSAFARAKKYEHAATLRDQIASLNRIFQHSPYLKKDISEDREKALNTLKDLLHLTKIPSRIECYDISHHQGDTSVASMVVFENGIPQKNEYRKFIMRSVIGINDPAMMHEVLARRMRHDEWQLPDLIIVDGGKTQLGAARLAIRERIPVASIAKREEELHVPRIKMPFKLKSLPSPLLHMITHLRDEAHRFAISFHRKRRRRLVVHKKGLKGETGRLVTKR